MARPVACTVELDEFNDLSLQLSERGIRVVLFPTHSAALLHHLFIHFTPIRSAFFAWITHVFGGGIHAGRGRNEDGSPKERVNDKFARELELFWKPVGIQIMASLFQYGMVILSFTHDGRPVVWELSESITRIKLLIYPDGHREYLLFFRPAESSIWMSQAASEYSVKQAFVFEREGMNMMGQIESILQSIVNSSSFVMHMLTCATVAEEGRSHPPLVTVPLANTTLSPDEQRDWTDPGNPDAVTNNRIDKQIHSETGSHSQFVIMQRAIEAIMNGWFVNQLSKQGFDGGVNGLFTPKMVQAYSRHLINIPLDRTVANTHIPESPNFLMEAKADLIEEIGRLMSVPVSMFGQQRETKSVDESVRFLFISRVNAERKDVVNIFEFLTDIVFWKDLLQEMVTRIRDDEKKNINADKSLRSYREESELVFSIPGLTDPVLLKELYDRGEMDYATFRKYRVTMTGIQDIAKEQQPLPITSELYANQFKVKELELQDKQITEAAKAKQQAANKKPKTSKK